MKATVSHREVKAVMLFCSDDEADVKSSVCMRYRPGSAPVLIAIDGIRMAVLESSAEQDDPEPEAGEREIVLSQAFLKAACALSKSIGGKNLPWMTFENKAGSDQLTVSFMGSDCYLESEKGAIVDKAFPNWRATVPGKNVARTPANQIGFNPEYVADFGKVAKFLDSESTAIQLTLVGEQGLMDVHIPTRPQFYGLIMQTKVDEDVGQPEFLSETDKITRVESPGSDAQ